jgi:hypothetical protein
MTDDTQFEYCPVCNQPVLYWQWQRHMAAHELEASYEPPMTEETE